MSLHSICSCDENVANKSRTTDSKTIPVKVAIEFRNYGNLSRTRTFDASVFETFVYMILHGQLSAYSSFVHFFMLKMDRFQTLVIVNTKAAPAFYYFQFISVD